MECYVDITHPTEALPEKSYVLIRAGGVKKLQKYDAKVPVHIPGTHRCCRVEVLQHVGTCDVCVDPALAEQRECLVASHDPKMNGFTMKWQSSPNPNGDGAGIIPAQVISKDDKNAELREYLDNQNVEGLLAGAVRQLLKERPKDARSFLLNYIGGGAPMQEQAVASVPRPPAPASDNSIFVINGFYMAMRDCYTRPGAVISYFEVEWNAASISWHDFRTRVLGATDPNSSQQGSLRASVKEQWRALGLHAPPTIRDNGVHASASPLEAMAERVNWLEGKIDEDPFSMAMKQAGVPVATQQEWLSDPQVEWHKQNQSLFDLLEDLDTEECIAKGSRIMGGGDLSDAVKAACPKNRAFLFVKPHATVGGGAVEALVREKMSVEGITILREGSIDSKTIDEKKLVDRHYGAIASKASLLQPKDTNPSAKALEQFGMKFSSNWQDTVNKGLVFNALDACKKMGIDGDQMEVEWGKAKDANQLVKFGGGFYCARIPLPEPKAAAAEVVYTINGFYMSMRDCYTRPGAKLRWFKIEWDAEATGITWSGFRGDVLGATDPSSSSPGSLRGIVKEQWKSFGLQAAPTIRDNGVHASASPFEAMAERVNWLECNIEEDPMSKALSAAGVSLETQKAWCSDPQVECNGKTGSLFDHLEDMDAWPLIERAARIVGGNAEAAKAICPKNSAFLFIKPHAMVGGESSPVEALVRQKLGEKGFSILGEGVIEAAAIDQKKLIDKHYGAIASKASLLKPAETNPSAKALEQFGMKFGIPWQQALSQNLVFNAVDACSKLGINGDDMEKRWMKAKDDDQLVKFGGGFYCASIPAVIATAAKSLYTINGFYMAMRDCYTTVGANIHWFDVEWDREKSSWADFRSVILGATDPEASAPGSLRGQIKARWQELGLTSAPSIANNGVHASASPLEAMAERANWLGDDLEQDTLSKALADVGVPLATQREWCQDPQVAFEGKNVSLFDTLEDLDVWPLMGRSARIMDVAAPGDDKKSSCPANRALLFVKPHAFNDQVVTLVRERLAAQGLTVRRDGAIGYQKIDEEKLIDKHYGAIASKASLLTPAQTNPSAKARESFGMTFGLPWDDALASGQVLNAVDACKALNINGSDMSTLWNAAKTKGELIKFGGGFYCAKIA